MRSPDQSEIDSGGRLLTAPFDSLSPTRIVFGPDRIDELGELANQLGARRVLVVSDDHIVAVGHVPRGIESLRKAGLDTRLFDGVKENPTTVEVEAGLAVAQDYQPDLLVGLGGGSSMDCAKGINFLLTNGGRMQDYRGVGKARRPMLPSIAVPTTTGTGSETQSFALISDAETRTKMACGDKKASFRIALLDPKLILTQPPKVTALTGIDALAHALETFVTNRRNAFSLAFSREAWMLISGNFLETIERPDNLAARAAMQLGACFAGLAIENSMLGATHALANPLTAHYQIPHGQAIGLMLPAVIRFNGEQCGNWYRDLLECTARRPRTPGPDAGPEGLADFVAEVVRGAGLPRQLSACGVGQDRLAELAADAASQWTATFNPRPITEQQMLELYRETF